MLEFGVIVVESALWVGGLYVGWRPEEERIVEDDEEPEAGDPME